ncbi:hypothetical protein D3C81_1965900 [compost metagenome]
MLRLLLFAPFHALGNRILMRTGESCKYKLATVRVSFAHSHFGQSFINGEDRRNVLKIQLRVYPMRVHVQGQRNNVYVPRPLSIAE